MASSNSKRFEEATEYINMIKFLEMLGIYHKELGSTDAMKEFARQHLSKDKHDIPKVQASTILLEARAENIRKRKELSTLSSGAKKLFDHFYKEQKHLSPEDGRIAHETIQRQIDQLKQENVHILVAGETSAGKSSFINLILGEEVVPYEFLPSTSTICELKYGKERKIVLHHKADSTKQERKETLSYVSPKVLESYVGGAHEGKGSIYEKVEIYWPHQLLQAGISIVDSPGIGEEESMDNMVIQYLTQAFAFVYVIDTSREGGVKTDRIVKLLNCTIEKVFEKDSKGPSQGSQNTPLEHKFQSSSALFLCNKWDEVLFADRVDPDKLREIVINKLKNCWPGLVTRNQVFFMSVKHAKMTAEFGGVSDDFENFMNGMRSMILKSFETRLDITWRRLDYFVSWISYQATSFLVNASRKKNEEMQEIRRRLDVLKIRQSKDLIEIRGRIDNTVHEAVETLITYLKSDGVLQRFSDWAQDEVRETFEKKGSDGVNQMFQKKLRDVIDKWEEEKFKETKESLLQQIKHSFHSYESQLRSLRGNVTGGFPNVPGIDPLPEGVSFLGRVFVKISWFIHTWVLPFSWISKPAFLSSNSGETWEQILRSYLWFNSETSDAIKELSEKYLSKAAEKGVLKPFVKKILQEAEQYLSFIETQVPKEIEADKRLLEELSREKRPEGEITATYRPILDGALDIQEKLAFFGLREVGAADICSEWLDWNQGSYKLGAGKFSIMYRGKMTRHGEEHAVALKVFQEVRLAKNASRVIQEANQLSKLDHPHLVKFYGTAVVNENHDLKAILVMELCKENLRNHFKSNPISVPVVSGERKHVLQAFKWVMEISSALDYIHHKKVVHRDLKLEKILLSEDNAVKLYDVSNCKEVDSITRKHGGTPRYMAPEVLRYEMNDFKADIYSFGIVLWEIWFGQEAFASVDLRNLQHFTDLVSEGLRPEGKESKKTPCHWKGLMEKCWDRDPGKRPTAGECEKIITKLYNEWSG